MTIDKHQVLEEYLEDTYTMDKLEADIGHSMQKVEDLKIDLDLREDYVIRTAIEQVASFSHQIKTLESKLDNLSNRLEAEGVLI